MNLDNIEGLRNEDISTLYDDIIESPELISPHICCYNSSSNIPLADWDYFGGGYARVWSSFGNRTRGAYSDSWNYTHILCNNNCPHGCSYAGYACYGYGVYYRNGWN